MRATRLHPLGMGLRPLYLLLLQLLLQLLATWQVAETQPVLIIESVKLTILPGQHVASGTDVTLLCDPKITSGTGTPLKHRYTFYRDSNLVYTNSTTASSLLHVIRQARVANSGSYKCSVAVHGQYKESDLESLNVTGLQTPVLVLNKATVTEGEEVTASCSAPNETGSFYFYFFEGSKKVLKGPTSENLAETQLKFSSPGNKSVTCQYVITLQPDLVTSSRSKPSRVYVQELFSRPVLTMKPLEAFEKESFSLTCYSHNISDQRIQRGQVKYSLYRNGRVLTPGDFGGKFNTTAEASRNGIYSCDAVVKHIRKSSNVIVFKAKDEGPATAVPTPARLSSSLQGREETASASLHTTP